MATEENQPRCSGKVVRFNAQKGYGFIIPDGDDDEIFVHQSDINFKGVRILHQGQQVEFLILLDDDKTKAVAVTGPNGAPLDQNPNTRHTVGRTHVGGYGFRSSGGAGYGGYSNRRNWNDGYYRGGPSGGDFRGGECDICGRIGHLARECAQYNDGGGGSCFNSDECDICGRIGHLARECTQYNGGGGGSCFNSDECYICGRIGHLARGCTQYNGDGSGSCFNCGGFGHMAKDCTSAPFGGGGGNSGCYNCGQLGHLARDCPQEGGGGSYSSGRSGGSGERRYSSGGSGRRYSSGGGGRYGSVGGDGGECYNCGRLGHIARECPDKYSDGNKE